MDILFCQQILDWQKCGHFWENTGVKDHFLKWLLTSIFSKNDRIVVNLIFVDKIKYPLFNVKYSR